MSPDRIETPRPHLGGRWAPTIVGPWRVLYRPVEAGPRVNDHAIFQDAEGRWRFVGIAAFEGRDLTTPYLGHAIGATLDEPMSELPVLFEADPDGEPKWAPHVIVHEDTWHLYCGPGKIRHYVSPDGMQWSFRGYAIESEWRNFRDTMVLRVAEDEWLMYATDRGNSVSVFRSADLDTWSFVQTAFQARSPATTYPSHIDISSAESPFAIEYDGAYYLSVCLTTCSLDTYAQTIVLRSEDPLDFGVYAADSPETTADLVTTLATHAAEYVETPEGRWLVTACGWSPVPGAEDMIPGALCIAPLEWKRA